MINHGNLTIWFDPDTQWYAQPQSRQGRNQIYLDTAIQCCLMIKSLFRFSLRMVIVDRQANAVIPQKIPSLGKIKSSFSGEK